MSFADRQDAGSQLADHLKEFADRDDVVVLGLPRGGVVTAAEVAKALHLPLDVVVPRKIGFPGNPELAIGAVTEDGEAMLQEELVNRDNISEEYLMGAIEEQRQESQRRLKTYRGNRKPLDLKGKTALLIDDGVATGATMMAAIQSCRAKHAQQIIVAVPVIAPDTIHRLEGLCDQVRYLDAPSMFGAVGRFYEDFPQTNDEEVIQIMQTKPPFGKGSGGCDTLEAF